MLGLMCVKGEGGMSGELTAYMWIKLAAISDKDAQIVASGEPKMSSTKEPQDSDWLMIGYASMPQSQINKRVLIR